jgi:RNA polymerase sigma-70 factor, ECF subfamily
LKGKKVLRDEQKLKDFLITGEYSSVETLIRLHEDSLYGLCRKLTQNRTDADDLYQQTWLKAISKAQTIKKESFKNWLYIICINVYRDQYRKARRREKVTIDRMDKDALEYVLESATDGVTTESIAIENYTRKLLVDKINKLPDKQRLPVMLHYFEDMDYSECARILGIPIGTIKSRLNSAKKKLQTEMEKELSV